MKQLHATKIVKQAHDLGIEVVWAKTPNDVRNLGVHLVEPSYKQIVDGLEQAILHNCGLVTIHSSLTWPYTRGMRNNDSEC